MFYYPALDTGASVCYNPAMRKLLRNSKTGAFLTESGTWISNFAAARVFDSFTEVEAACLELHLEDCELYYSFSKAEPNPYDFSIPLGDGAKKPFSMLRAGQHKVVNPAKRARTR